MNLMEYIRENYKAASPIFLGDLKKTGLSENNICKQMERLVQTGELRRFDTGIYYMPDYSVFKSGTGPLRETVLEQKYLFDDKGRCGYRGGMQFYNDMNLTTQVSNIYEIVSNYATTAMRKKVVQGMQVVIRKPKAKVTEENWKILRLLDLLQDLYPVEESDEVLQERIKKYLKDAKITFAAIKPYLAFYPDSIYKNLYRAGVLSETVA